jgi:hypothetical protein
VRRDAYSPKGYRPEPTEAPSAVHGQRPERPDAEPATATAAQWAAFLEARIKEELDGAMVAAEDGWWELTEPDARRFGVQTAGGRVFAPVLTGRGHFADQAAALHIVRNQPYRTREDLQGKSLLVAFLKRSIEEGKPDNALLVMVQQFSAPFIDHPEHPEYAPPEES